MTNKISIFFNKFSAYILFIFTLLSFLFSNNEILEIFFVSIAFIAFFKINVFKIFEKKRYVSKLELFFSILLFIKVILLYNRNVFYEVLTYLFLVFFVFVYLFLFTNTKSSYVNILGIKAKNKDDDDFQEDDLDDDDFQEDDLDDDDFQEDDLDEDDFQEDDLDDDDFQEDDLDDKSEDKKLGPDLKKNLEKNKPKIKKSNKKIR